MVSTSDADLVRQARERFNLTQEQLGDMVGATAKSVSNWESGKPMRATTRGRLEAAVRDLEQRKAGGVDLAQRLADVERRLNYVERIVLQMRAEQMPTPPTEADAETYGLAAKRGGRERPFDSQE